MNDSYNPLTIDAATLDAILARVDRYLRRHGSKGGEHPIPLDQFEDVRQSIIADWMGDDWDSRELLNLARHGKTLFAPSLSETGRHLRAVLFHCGRARKRNWRTEGATRRVADNRRDCEGFDGVGQSSRAHDPARTVAAVESVSGELVLSKQASRNRSRAGLPLKYRGGIPCIPVDAPPRLKWMKRRNSKGCTIDVVERLEDRTVIEIRPYTRFNFERVGQVANRDVPRTVRKLPRGVTADTLRVASDHKTPSPAAFAPAPLPMAGVPAMPGDGTEWRGGNTLYNFDRGVRAIG